MSVTLTSYDETETIFIYSFINTWSIHDYVDVDIGCEQLYTSSKRIDLIFDLTQSDGMPTGIMDFMHHAGKFRYPSTSGMGVIIKPPIMLKIMLRAMGRIYPHTCDMYRIADTLDEALQLIHHHRQA